MNKLDKKRIGMKKDITDNNFRIKVKLCVFIQNIFIIVTKVANLFMSEIHNIKKGCLLF